MLLDSFDIFETLLVRDVAVPVDLFWVMEQRLVEQGVNCGDRGVFRAIRERVEREGRREVSGGEISLREIHQRLAKVWGWTEAVRDVAMGIELGTEADSLRAVPGMVEQVAESRATAGKVVFISDMYLPSEFLETILRREGFFRDGDRVYMSNEHRRSKASGDLFELVRRDFPQATEWRHWGDNLHADVQIPLKRGIIAHAFTLCHLNRYEMEMRGDGRLWRSRAAAAMRLARLKNPEIDEHRKVIWNSGCNVVGPLWFGFVHWCLEEAVRRGIKRLYFVSRDGQIFLKIAQELVRSWGYDVECRYLYGSRQAWHPAALREITRDDLEWLVPSTRFLSVDQVFAFLKIPPDEFTDKLESIGLPVGRWSENLDFAERIALGNLLLDRSVSQVVADSAACHRQTVIAYLSQEGFLDEVPFGIVDIGWFGNLQKSLAGILHAGGRVKESALNGLYFGLIGKRRFSDDQIILGYWNRLSASSNFIRRHNIALLEIFAAADHGSVIGYERVGDRWEPQLKNSQNRAALDWGLDALQGGVVAFAVQMAALLRRDEVAVDEFLEINHQLHRLFYKHPCLSEVEAWAKFRYCEEQIEKNFVEFLPKMSWWEMSKASISRRFRPDYWWAEGSLARRPCLPVRLFLVAQRCKSLLKP